MAKASKKRIGRLDPSIPMGVPPPPTGAPSAHYPDLGRDRPSYDFPSPPTPPPDERMKKIADLAWEAQFKPIPYYPPRTHPKATISLVVGIIAVIFVFACFPVGLILGIIAVAFGLAALKGIKNDPEKYKGKGLAIWGLILGAFGVAIPAVLVFFMVVVSVMPL